MTAMATFALVDARERVMSFSFLLLVVVLAGTPCRAKDLQCQGEFNSSKRDRESVIAYLECIERRLEAAVLHGRTLDGGSFRITGERLAPKCAALPCEVWTKSFEIPANEVARLTVNVSAIFHGPHPAGGSPTLKARIFVGGEDPLDDCAESIDSEFAISPIQTQITLSVAATCDRALPAGKYLARVTVEPMMEHRLWKSLTVNGDWVLDRTRYQAEPIPRP